MQRRIPAWLGIPWWWVFILAAVLASLQPLLHLPVEPVEFVPGIWLLLQAWWMKAAFPRSKGIYVAPFVLALGILTRYVPKDNLKLLCLFLLLQLVAFVPAILLLCRDFERAFDDESLPVLEVTKFYALFFGPYYFQYHLHDLYEIQRSQAESMR